MRYTHHNVKVPCCVFDVDTQQKLARIAEINTEEGWVKQNKDPLRLDADGEFECERIRFRSIYLIFGGADRPVMFHCYGRRNASTS